MRHEQERDTMLQQVTSWPLEDRVAFAYQILREARKQTRDPTPRNTADLARGIARGSTPPPDDATVKKWMEEHRMRKYG